MWENQVISRIPQKFVVPIPYPVGQSLYLNLVSCDTFTGSPESGRQNVLIPRPTEPHREHLLEIFNHNFFISGAVPSKDQCFQDHTDINERNLGGGGCERVKSKEACQRLCQVNSRCVAFVFAFGKDCCMKESVAGGYFINPGTMVAASKFCPG